MRRRKPYAAIHKVERRRFLIEQERKAKPNIEITMSKSEGIGNSIERIKEPTEEERQRIREEFERIKTAGAYSNKLHPVNEDGEALCSDREEHNVNNWSNPKPIDSYPPGYAPFCRYCVREWRGWE